MFSTYDEHVGSMHSKKKFFFSMSQLFVAFQYYSLCLALKLLPCSYADKAVESQQTEAVAAPLKAWPLADGLEYSECGSQMATV